MAEVFTFAQFKDLHLMEEHRIASFREWPFDMRTSCNIERMAEAGFYWNGNERENDTVTCFVCCKTLDGWEATDDPWKEHAKHAPQCLFVKYSKNEADLSVEEFLQIFTAVMQNQIMNKVESVKKKVLKMSQAELNAYLDKK